MKVDIVTIFPTWFDSLDVSLTGKARTSGLIDLTVHDLRDWTHDRHRTVDDTPYGGGAGMVMKPEPWGEALDALRGDASPTLLVPTPSGIPFTQALAGELPGGATSSFACGRYEGIDQRVLDEATSTYDVREVSLGDYVLNGGEVAATAISRRSSACCPASWATPSRWPRSPTRTASWSTPSTPSPRPGADATCPPVCCPVTTQPSRPGAMPSPYDAPSPVDPTSRTRRRRSAWVTSPSTSPRPPAPMPASCSR